MSEVLVDTSVDFSTLILQSIDSLSLNKVQRIELDRLVQLLTHTENMVQARRFVDYMSRLPIDGTTLIAGLAYCAISDQLLSIERVRDKGARDLATKLIRLASVDSAASTSAILQLRRNKNQTENVRGMLVSMIDDPRVIVLKLIERLVRLKVNGNESPSEVTAIAVEVLNFYAPLASRLGVWHLKWVLEDAALQHIDPASYREIADQLALRRLEREQRVSLIKSDLSWRLNEAGLSANIQGRAKNIYGIYRKMKEKDLNFSDIRDVTGIRVIVDSVPECYQVLGIVHLAWPHLANEFDDYIANPKSNGYRSLHTAVYGPQGHIIEVQIRTHQMHLESELGVCSHWEYKGASGTSPLSEEIDWLREVLNWHEEFIAQDDRDFTQPRAAKTSRVIYVQTPKRHVVDLPSGSTVLDFAFKVHSEVGLHCVGAEVDGQPTALNSELETGQMVEVITSDESTPQRRWLDPDLAYFKNSKTRDILRSHFASQSRQTNVDAGRDRVVDELRRLGLALTVDDVLDHLTGNNTDDFLLAVGLGTENIRDRLLEFVADQSNSEFRNGEDKQLKCVHLVAVDRQRLASDITDEIASLGVNVVSMQLGAPTLGEEANAKINIEVEDLMEASLVVIRLRRLRNVSDVWITED